MTKINGIIFDMDGLLVDSESVYYEGTQLVADQYQLPYTKATYLQSLGLSDQAMHQMYHEQYDELIGQSNVEAFIHESYTYCYELLASGAAALKPGVNELFAYCELQGIQKVVASSNTRGLITLLLTKAGIINQFSAIFSVEDVPQAKPDPALFLKAQKWLDLPKEEVLVLEDSRNGILAAHAASIPVIMIPDLLPAPADIERLVTLESLHQVPAYLQNLNP